MENTFSNPVTEVQTNRWNEIFGHDESSPFKFIDYLANRFWKVRGSRVEVNGSEIKTATNGYLKSLVEESGYWEHKAEIKDVCDAVDDKLRVADDFTYKPVPEQTIKNGDGTTVLFNRYDSPNNCEIEPTDEELNLWKDYWRYLLPAEHERIRVQQWVASLAFQPHKRTGVAVLLHGTSTGTGKGTLGEMLTELVGHGNTAKPMNAVQALTGRFNAALEAKVLFIVDELYEGGSFKLANGIKGKITEPKLEVEPKGQELRKIDNFCNFLASSNHLTPLWLDPKDRRWEVYSVEYDDESKQHKDAVNAFRKWFEADRAHATAVIRRLLGQVDLSDYRPWSDGAMMTKAKQLLIANSVSSKEDDFELYWHTEKFDSEMVVNASAVFKDQWRNISNAHRGEILTNLGCTKLDSDSNVKINGTQSRKWWITPKGITAGVKPFMNGKEIGLILKQHRSDVADAAYDEASDALTVKTQLPY